MTAERTMTDLRALLGDRYEAVLDCADEALQGVCGRPNSCWKHGHWDDAEAVLAAVLPDLLAAARREGQAEAWDEGHETPWEREPDDCRCNAWSSSECGCGKYGTGRLVTPNPYRRRTPGALGVVTA